MTAMIKTLRRDLADHQEVEKELAKRSHFCQKVIQKYKTQIKQLKTSIDEQNKKDTGVTPQQRDESDLLEYLNERIGNYEMRLKQTQTHLK
jgi:chromosome segregation ATPase